MRSIFWLLEISFCYSAAELFYLVMDFLEINLKLFLVCGEESSPSLLRSSVIASTRLNFILCCMLLSFSDDYASECEGELSEPSSITCIPIYLEGAISDYDGGELSCSITRLRVGLFKARAYFSCFSYFLQIFLACNIVYLRTQSFHYWFLKKSLYISGNSTRRLFIAFSLRVTSSHYSTALRVNMRAEPGLHIPSF